MTLPVRLATAGTLTGATLYDVAGAKLGVVKDLFIDKVTGHVEFVVGATGGFLGVGEKFHPIPWSLLTYNAAPEGYVLHIDRDALEDAPAYDRDQLSSAHYGWDDQVHRYFATLKPQAPTTA